ncbi:Tripartite ATP-independent periplasmic transporter, DctQ component [Lutibaculum baratangense AMV1]|uniref:TRAP transporter small permease protein n=2 Tax=Lutibaculum TaxID=1358438 RepID=V4QRZ7_9HYPH|nr:Tripartite ATP-independent periplasmic transporter, DctQ component [Lutibaculum baratangense AMV1]
MRVIAQGLRWLVWTMNVLAGVALILMTALVVLATVMRYFVGAPLMFSDELVGLLFCGTSFLAIPISLLQRRHISVDIVVGNLPDRGRRLIDVLAVLIFITFAAAFIYNAFDFADFSRQIGSSSDIGSLLLWPWMMVLPATFLVAALIALIQLVDAVRILFGRPPLMEENRELHARGQELHA